MTYLIAHSGIKGQKWGQRRYRNPDGTLTPEGRRRYKQYNKSEDQKKYENDIRGPYQELSTKDIAAINARDKQVSEYKKSHSTGREKFKAFLKKNRDAVIAVTTAAITAGLTQVARDLVDKSKSNLRGPYERGKARVSKIFDRAKSRFKHSDDPVADAADELGTYFAHYGVKGQKWGNRRYQNEDGSLTEEGKERYGVDDTYSPQAEEQKSKGKKALKVAGIVAGTAAAVGGGILAYRKLKNRNRNKGFYAVKDGGSAYDSVKRPIAGLLGNAAEATTGPNKTRRSASRAKFFMKRKLRHSDDLVSDAADELGTYFAHHGIKGQKWGIRRYQNEDGTLTEAGKKRYGEEGSRTAKQYQKFLNDADKTYFRDRVEMYRTGIGSLDKAISDRTAKDKKKGLDPDKDKKLAKLYKKQEKKEKDVKDYQEIKSRIPALKKSIDDMVKSAEKQGFDVSDRRAYRYYSTAGQKAFWLLGLDPSYTGVGHEYKVKKRKKGKKPVTKNRHEPKMDDSKIVKELDLWWM